LVTVGIPVYNDEKYVGAAIEDILAQTYRNLEIVISDNGSTDGSADICQRYAGKDARVRYVRQERNIGPHANFRYLLDHAQGVYFMWAASDDRWDPEFIARLAGSLESRPEATVAFCPYSEIDEQG
ncbi:nucleotide-diphospho-sugar transferase, partial [Tribonema minus]